ncbi:MAG: YbhB/YbcL family Raf kinase inhibitor-like protein [Gemmatimonadota bacterium]
MIERAGTGVAAAALALSLAARPVDAQTTFVVESPTMKTGEMMPRDYTPDGRNVSPPLTWSGLPAGTRQIAVICQDHGAGNPPPWVHWIIYDIPGTATGLPEAIPFDDSQPMPRGLEGAVQGANGWGLPMYRGPAPPGTTLHHYHFAVFALDTELDLPPGLTRDELLEAIDGHVLGEGSMTPHYRRRPAPETLP